MNGLMNRSAYVESAKTTITDDGIIVHVKGNWPNPSWELEKIEKKITDGVLHLWIIGKHKPGMVIQVLHPFEHEITIDKEILTQIHQRKIIIYSRDAETHVLSLQ